MYPKQLGSSQIFREDFSSKKSLVDNGGVLTSTPIINGYYESNGSSYVNMGSQRLGGYKKITIETEIDNITSAPADYEGWTTLREAAVTGFDIGADSTNIYVVFRGGTGAIKQQAHAGLGLFDGAKHTLTVTNDGTNTNLYSDGILVGTPTASGIGLMGAGNLEIGARVGISLMEAGNRINRVRIFNTSFTAQEVSNLYDGINVSRLDASKADVYLPLKSSFNNGSAIVTENLGTGGNFKLGDGAGTNAPTQVYPNGALMTATQYLKTVTDLTIASTKSFTIFMAFDFTDTATVGSHFLLEIGAYVTNGLLLLQYGHNFYFYWNSSGVVKAVSAVFADRLQTLAIVSNGGSVTAYIDGVQIGTATDLTARPALSGAYQATYGKLANGAIGKMFKPYVKMGLVATPEEIRYMHQKTITEISI